MKFKLTDNPPDIRLKVSAAGDVVGIRHRYMTSSERMSVLELLSAGGLASGMQYLQRFLVGWDGIEDENGKAIEFPAQSPDAAFAVNPTVDAILGRIPISQQLQLVVEQLAANGVNFKQFERVMAELIDTATMEEVGKSGDPL